MTQETEDINKKSEEYQDTVITAEKLLQFFQAKMKKKLKIEDKNILQLKKLARRYPIIAPAINLEVAKRFAKAKI